MTTSTARTATPPKLLDTTLNFGEVEDDFESAFDDIGLGDVSQKRSHGESAEPVWQLHLSRPVEKLMAVLQDSRLPFSSPTTSPNEENGWQPSPWDHRRSESRLLGGFDSEHEAAQPVSPQSDLAPNSKPRIVPTTSHRSLERPVSKPRGTLRRSFVHTDNRRSSLVEDEDAKLVLQSLLSKREVTSEPLPPSKEDSDSESDTSLFGNTTTLDRPAQREPVAMPAPRHAPEMDEGQAGASIAAHARLAEQYERRAPLSTNKVMTPSQFEHYRQQQELRRSNSDASKSDDSAVSEFDEEDEAEKNREAERQRRKQEAHLSVYRQQMMKVTGQQSPGPSLRPEVEGTSNTPNPGVRAPNQGSNSGGGKNSEGDDDDDVPLAILAAHGFPNKSRPPSQLGVSKSTSNLRASYQPAVPSPGQMPGEQGQNNRGSLPVFARNLPRDPYFGASLVNPANRESLAFGGGSSPQGSPSPGLPPGGLVGVIASEERARANRRNGPNAPGPYEHQVGMAGMNHYSSPYPAMAPNLPGMPVLHNGLSPMENTHMQLSQQMTQLMQTQMQWMQQMMHMQGMPGVPGTQGTPQSQMSRGFPSPPANADMRPKSLPSSPALNAGPMGPRADQRTLSMLDPNMSRWRNPQPPQAGPAHGNRPDSPSGRGYATSIAPSERSNVGMAPRYRPVSIMPQEQYPNAFLPVSKPWGDANRRSVSMASPSHFQLDKINTAPTVTVRAVSPGDGRLATSEPKLDDEADDDEGWAEMMRKRERKKDDWKTKRATSALGNLVNVAH